MRIPGLTEVVRIGHADGDEQRVRTLKSVSVVILAVIFSMTVAYFFEDDRSRLHQTMDVVLLAIELTGLWVLHAKKDMRALSVGFVPAFLTAQFVFVQLNGNAEGEV